MKVGETVTIKTSKYGKEYFGLDGIIVSDIRKLIVRIYNGIELVLTADEVELKNEVRA